MTDDLVRTTVTVWSEGSRLAATLVRPAGVDELRPAVLLCHGWGGLKEQMLTLYGNRLQRPGTSASRSTTEAGARATDA